MIEHHKCEELLYLGPFHLVLFLEVLSQFLVLVGNLVWHELPQLFVKLLKEIRVLCFESLFDIETPVLFVWLKLTLRWSFHGQISHLLHCKSVIHS